MQIKENDFIELDYTGKIKDGNIVFDTTQKSIAHTANILNPRVEYKPVVLCVGQEHILKGIDTALVGKEIGTDYTLELSPENAFGKKKMDLIQLIATHKFKKHGINPMPGLQVNIDNSVGIIKTVTGGRTLVDFNHPCAGKDVVYTFKALRVVTDVQTKVRAMTTMLLGEQLVADVVVKGNVAEITTVIKMPDEIQVKMTENIKKCVSEIITITYHEKKQEKQGKQENT
ncbi:MAG: peptidylprolyl isomerase [Candidatus Woesearchaeota archaeon]|jgi:FKBP-type peptidyl-prolyl cis-trans isomerase 2